MENTPSPNQPAQMSPASTPVQAPVPAKSSSKKTGIIVAVVVVVALIAGKLMSKNSTNQQATGSKSGNYKDGTYTATGDYFVHSGPEQITVGVTLKGGVITDSTFIGNGASGMSQRFMDLFASGYKSQVIGKNIGDVQLGKVSGSSLTPNGFNNALEKIKAQASV